MKRFLYFLMPFYERSQKFPSKLSSGDYQVLQKIEMSMSSLNDKIYLHDCHIYGNIPIEKIETIANLEYTQVDYGAL